MSALLLLTSALQSSAEVLPGLALLSHTVKIMPAQGSALLEGIVSEAGLLTDLRVVEPLDPALDRAAIDAALQWRFEPGRRNGQPIRVRVQMEFTFSIK